MRSMPYSSTLFILPLLLLFVLFFALGFSSGMILEGKSSFLLEVRADQALSLVPVIKAMPKPPAETIPPVAQVGKVDTYDIRGREQGTRGASSLTYAHRLNWSTAATLQMLACLGLIVVCLLVLADAFRAYRTRHPYLLAALAAAAIGVSVFIVVGPADIQGVVHDVLELTLEKDLQGIVTLWDLADASAFVAAVLLAMTVSVLILVPSERTPDGQDQLRQRMKQLSLLLYAGTVLLVLNVLQFCLLLGWVQAHLLAIDDVAPAQLQDAFESLVTTRSIFLTLVLFGAYLPGVLALRENARSMARAELKEGAGESDVESWLKKKGFTSSPVEFLPRVLALLAPFLTGTVYDLLKEFTK